MFHVDMWSTNTSLSGGLIVKSPKGLFEQVDQFSAREIRNIIEFICWFVTVIKIGFDSLKLSLTGFGRRQKEYCRVFICYCLSLLFLKRKKKRKKRLYVLINNNSWPTFLLKEKVHCSTKNQVWSIYATPHYGWRKYKGLPIYWNQRYGLRWTGKKAGPTSICEFQGPAEVQQGPAEGNKGLELSVVFATI